MVNYELDDVYYIDLCWVLVMVDFERTIIGASTKSHGRRKKKRCDTVQPRMPTKPHMLVVVGGNHMPGGWIFFCR